MLLEKFYYTKHLKQLRIILCIQIIMLMACSNPQSPPPSYVIPKEKLIYLLVDYHLAQGLSNSYVFRERTKYIERINLCDSVIKAYGYTRATFDSTIQYYAEHVEEFDQIYERVITEINKWLANVEEKKQPQKDTLNTKQQ